MKRLLIIVLSSGLFYALVRYNIGKEVPLEHIPTYIFNKTLALASFILFGMSYLFGKSGKINKNNISLAAYGLAIVHLLLTILILSPKRYPKFYDDGILNLSGEITLFAGVMAIAIFTMPFLSSVKEVGNSLFGKDYYKTFKLANWAYGFSILHVVAMGVEGWIKTSEWPLYMPPISLIAFGSTIAVLFARVLSFSLVREKSTEIISVEEKA